MVPQRPYLPLGTLANTLTYPFCDPSSVGTARLAAALGEVGLGSYASQLETVDNWGQRLSLGEQQRLAFARVLLAEPALLFLDEATSTFAQPGEVRAYALLPSRPSPLTVTSFGTATIH